jgi:hypothetical protein
MAKKKPEKVVLPKRFERVRYFHGDLGERSATVVDVGLGGNTLRVDFLEEDGPYLQPGQRIDCVPYYKKLPADWLPGVITSYCLPEKL